MRLSAIFNNTVMSFPDDYPIVEYYENDLKKYLYKNDYIDLVKCFSGYLEKELKDFEKGSWIILRYKTNVYWFPIFFAASRIGYNVMFVDENSNTRTLDHCIKMGNTKAIITDKDLNIAGVKFISFDDIVSSSYKDSTYTEWSEYMCVCTSGTTGLPRSIVYKADTILQIQKNLGCYLFYSPEMHLSLNGIKRSEMKVLVTLPMRHIFGFEIPNIFGSYGCTMVFPRNSTIFELIRCIKEDNIWMTYGVPALWKAIYRVYKSNVQTVDAQSFASYFGKNFRYGMIGGARIDLDFKKLILASGIIMNNAYGGTENGGCISMGYFNTEPLSDIKGEYSGITVNNHKTYIKDEKGVMNKEGTGELVISNNTSIYDGTLVDGKFISRVETKGELYYTGDVFTKSGPYHYYQGRCNGMIVNDSGENIYPEELEEDFSIIDGKVIQYGVYGINDEPVLLIHSNDYDSFDNSNILELIKTKNNSLPFYKRISSVFIFRNKMPVTLKNEISKKDILKFIKDCKEQNNMVKEIKLKGRLA